jgi:hypothetical protein
MKKITIGKQITSPASLTDRKRKYMSIFTGNFGIEKKFIAAFLLTVSAVAGIFYFALFIIHQSKIEAQLIFGLSANRLLLAVIWLGLLAINIGAILFPFLNLGTRKKELERKANLFFAAHKVVIMGVLYIALVAIGAFLLAMFPPVLTSFQFLSSFHIRLGGFLTWVFIAIFLLVITLRIIAAETLSNEQRISRLDTILGCFIVFIATLFIYKQIGAWIGWTNRGAYTYWDLLSAQFLQGKLYLENPTYIHDLVLHNGNWYVPMPPFPAIAMLPVVTWFGVENINTSYLSILYSAITGVISLLILRQLVQLKWLQLSWHATFWLMALFLLGTPHLWVGINGRGWFTSQILATLFLSLAIYAALRSWSVWWIASFIAVAMLSRPNTLMTWPFVFAISMQLLKEKHGTIEWKQAFLWSVKTAVPVISAILILLIYNYIRFENFFDFGYASLKGSQSIVNNVQTHGLFSAHFIPENLYVMLLKMPQIRWETFWTDVSKGNFMSIGLDPIGMSIFATTPSLLYLFRRYPGQWWIWGAWITTLFNIIILSLYSNTGSAQFGYRYILDFIAPLITLLAVGVSQKVPWHFMVVALISIAINLYGAYWFMSGG